MKSLGITRFGLFGDPMKVLWSPFHNLSVVLGRQALYTYDNVSGNQKAVYDSATEEFMDMDVSTGGYISLIYADPVSGVQRAKILGPDFFSIPCSIEVAGELIRGTVFVSDTNPVVVSDTGSSGGAIATTVRLLSVNGSVQSANITTNGSVVSVLRDAPSGTAMAVTSGGDIWVIPVGHDGLLGVPLMAGNAGGKVALAASGLSAAVSSNAPQGKVRVYVGSREWANDMWDSGEITTDAPSIPYGGGDNLEPGHRYWVHIMTWHQDSGWSSPQISGFVVPRE